jgi:Holliday junction resolvase RusA-like endonuclease
MAYKASVALVARSTRPDDWDGNCPLGMMVYFYLVRPKKLGSGAALICCCKPDLDNLLKALWDALKGIAFPDDSRLASVLAMKYYAASDDCPRTSVQLWEIR